MPAWLFVVVVVALLALLAGTGLLIAVVFGHLVWPGLKDRDNATKVWVAVATAALTLAPVVLGIAQASGGVAAAVFGALVALVAVGSVIIRRSARTR